MPLPIAGGLFAWLLGLVISAFKAFTVWMMGHMLYQRTFKIALTTAFLVTISGFAVAVSLSIKMAILAIQYNMPQHMAMVTFFLPDNINTIMSVIFTSRVSLALYRWSVKFFTYYLPNPPGYAGLV